MLTPKKKAYQNEYAMTRLIIFIILLQTCKICSSKDVEHKVQITDIKEQTKLIGQLGKPLGTMLTIQGILINNSYKGYQNELNLAVQKINDSSIQELITIPLSPYFGEFGVKPLPKLEKNSTYSLRVYETGEFAGIPGNAFEEAGILYLQTKGFYFQNRLVVLSGEKIKPIKETPNSFIGKMALLSGKAKNENDTAFINTSDEKLRLIGFRKWTESEIGKLAEVYGKIEQSEAKDIYNVRDCNARLVKLEDQIGMTVKLRGRAINLNEYWWFNYRGINLYVEKMEDLPGWIGENHFRPIEITGILEQAILPALDQIGRENQDSKLCFIIRKPSWKPIEKLLAVEDVETED